MSTDRISNDTPPAPPVAGRRPLERTLHGVVLVDDYAWLKDPNWQQVLRDPSVLGPEIRAYLEAENRYTEAVLAPTDALQKALVAEMRGRIKEDDQSVPQPDGPFAYLSRFRQGGQHPLIGRTRRDSAGEPSILLDGDRAGQGKATTSSSAVRGIRRTTGWRRGAPIGVARSTTLCACATGRPARIWATWSNRPAAAASSGDSTRRSSFMCRSTRTTGR